MKSKEIVVNDKFEAIIPCKTSQNEIPSFNPSFKVKESNSRIKQNQIGVIKTHGIVYLYSENQIFFMNNSNLQLILKEDALTSASFLTMSLEEPIDKVFINSSEGDLLIVHYRPNAVLIQLYLLTDLILNQSTSSKQSILINKQCKDIQLTSIDSFLLLGKDNVLSIYSEQGELQNTFKAKCTLFHYDPIRDIIITQLDQSITVFNYQREEISTAQLSAYADDLAGFNAISLYFIQGFILCYLSKQTESSDDMIVFLEVNSENQIINGFIKSEFFFIEEKLQPKAAVFCHSIEIAPTIVFVINKQAQKMRTFFAIEKKGEGSGFEIVNVEQEDDQVINNCIDDEENMNCFVGFEVIDFKFTGYDSSKETIKSNEYDTPLLALALDAKGKLRVFSLLDSRSGEKLREIHADNDLFKKDLLSIKDKAISDKSKSIVKTSIRKEAKGGDSSIEALNKEKIESRAYNDKLNSLRNNFIRRLQFELDIKKEIILNQFNLASLDKDMQEIESKVIASTDYSQLIATLSKESKDYLNKRKEINSTLIESKGIIEKAKAELVAFSKQKRELDHIKSSSLALSKGIDGTSLQDIIASPLFQTFYGKSESMALSKDLSSIEQKCMSYSKQLKYHQELALISQEFHNRLSEINKKVAYYNKRMLYLNKLSETSDKKTFMETNQNDIFASYVKQFDCYLYELKRVYGDLKKDIEEKAKANQSIAPLNAFAIDKSAFQYAHERRIKKEMNDYGQELSKVLLNTPCAVTYADEEGCMSTEDLFCPKDIKPDSNEEGKKSLIEKDEEIIANITALEDVLIRIQAEKEKMNKFNEEEMRREAEKLLIAKQTEEKYNALNEKLKEYEKERAENSLNRNQKRENEKKDKERRDKEMKDKQEKERQERERQEREKQEKEQREQENKQKKKSKKLQKESYNDFEAQDVIDSSKNSNKHKKPVFDTKPKSEDEKKSGNEKVETDKLRKLISNVQVDNVKSKEDDLPKNEIHASPKDNSNASKPKQEGAPNKKEEAKNVPINDPLEEINQKIREEANQPKKPQESIQVTQPDKTVKEDSKDKQSMWNFSHQSNKDSFQTKKDFNPFATNNNPAKPEGFEPEKTTGLVQIPTKKEEAKFAKPGINAISINSMPSLVLPSTNSFNQPHSVNTGPQFGQSASLGNNFQLNQLAYSNFAVNSFSSNNNNKQSSFSALTTGQSGFFNPNANNANPAFNQGTSKVDNDNYFS